MNLLRKYKISKITNTPLSDNDKTVLDFIQDILKDLTPFVHKEYPESIFLMNSKNKWILLHSPRFKYLGIRHDGFWQVLDEKYKLSNNDIESILKYLLEDVFKEKIYKTPEIFNFPIGNLDDVYKKIDYPRIRTGSHMPIEEDFKLKMNNELSQKI